MCGRPTSLTPPRSEFPRFLTLWRLEEPVAGYQMVHVQMARIRPRPPVVDSELRLAITVVSKKQRQNYGRWERATRNGLASWPGCW